MTCRTTHREHKNYNNVVTLFSLGNNKPQNRLMFCHNLWKHTTRFLSTHVMTMEVQCCHQSRAQYHMKTFYKLCDNVLVLMWKFQFTFWELSCKNVKLSIFVVRMFLLRKFHKILVVHLPFHCLFPFSLGCSSMPSSSLARLKFLSNNWILIKV